MREVEWKKSKSGRINVKALTENARQAMLADMELPMAAIAGEVFLMGIDPFSLEKVLGRLRALGVDTDQTPDPPPPPPPPPKLSGPPPWQW
jgi:hypothetical protein